MMALLLGAAALLVGLVTGSFLNVVIARLPLMLERAWRAEWAEVAGAQLHPQQPFNLAFPGSHCPRCGSRLRWFELVPIASWVFLLARCRHCQGSISARYPLIELLTGLLFSAIAVRYGPSYQSLALCILFALLVALAAIDADTMLLPDALTQPLLWLGLAGALLPVLITSNQAIAGVMAGYLALWLPSRLFEAFTGRIGIGDGDIKLVAAAGAWTGLAILPITALALLISVMAHLVLGGRHAKRPFGPCLAFATALALLTPYVPGMSPFVQETYFPF